MALFKLLAMGISSNIMTAESGLPHPVSPSDGLPLRPPCTCIDSFHLYCQNTRTSIENFGVGHENFGMGVATSWLCRLPHIYVYNTFLTGQRKYFLEDEMTSRKRSCSDMHLWHVQSLSGSSHYICCIASLLCTPSICLQTSSFCGQRI